MGRRSINTTKSGKYMNPTDQASKYSVYSISNVIIKVCTMLHLSNFRKRSP